MITLGLVLLAGQAVGAAEPSAGRLEVSVVTTTRRPRRFHLMPGEWLLCSSRRGLWIPYWFGGKAHLAFQKHGARVHVREGGRDGPVVGVRLGTQTGRSELRAELRRRTSPLMIWCGAPAAVHDIPVLPGDRTFGFAIHGLPDLSPVAKLRNIHYLRLTTMPGQSDLSALAKLSDLKSLTITCLDAPDLAPLGALTKLEVLHIHCETTLSDLTPLARLANLRVLALHCADGVTDVAPVGQLGELRVLVLNGCSRLRALAPLAGLRRLTWLELSGCAAVDDLSPLEGLAELTWLDLTGCTGVATLAPLAGLTKLEHLGLRDAAKVASLAPLAKLPRLRELDLLGCDGVAELWPVRQVARRRPHRIWVDTRLRDQLVAIEEAAPGRTTIMMNGRHARTVSLPPEYPGELGGWANIAAPTSAPPPGIGPSVSRLAYPVGRHRGGAVLHFHWTDPRVLLGVDREVPHLVGVVATSPQGQAVLRGALAATPASLVIWADADAIPALPPLPAGRDITLATLGLATPLRTLRAVENLTGLYVESAAESTSDLAPLAHLADLRELVLPTSLRLTSLRHLAKMTQLRSLQVSLAERVADLRPLASLESLQTLQLRWSRATDLTPLADLSTLQALKLRGPVRRDALAAIAGLASLEVLSLETQGEPVDFGPLAGLGKLKALHLVGGGGPIDLAALAGLQGLEVLALDGYGRLADLSPLTRVPRLRVLHVRGSSGAADIATLRALERRGAQLHLDTRLRNLLGAAPE